MNTNVLAFPPQGDSPTPKLQYRELGHHDIEWTEWKDVPLVVVPDGVVKS